MHFLTFTFLQQREGVGGHLLVVEVEGVAEVGEEEGDDNKTVLTTSLACLQLKIFNMVAFC